MGKLDMLLRPLGLDAKSREFKKKKDALKEFSEARRREENK
jgi:hypothetical protein